MSDILMITNPTKYRGQKVSFRTLFLNAEEFYQREKLAKRFDEILWQAFHTHGKYARIARHIEYAAVAVEKKGNYLSSAFIIPVGTKWLLEYVVTDPKQQGKGAASAVMNRVMQEAKKQKIQWVILNCDPHKNSGQLPKFYSKFGFRSVD